MRLFSLIFGFLHLNSLHGSEDEHDAYVTQLNAMIEKQKRDLAIEEKYREGLRKQQEKLRSRTIEGEFEVVDTNSKQLEGNSKC